MFDANQRVLGPSIFSSEGNMGTECVHKICQNDSSDISAGIVVACETQLVHSHFSAGTQPYPHQPLMFHVISPLAAIPSSSVHYIPLAAIFSFHFIFFHLFFSFQPIGSHPILFEPGAGLGGTQGFCCLLIWADAIPEVLSPCT